MATSILRNAEALGGRLAAVGRSRTIGVAIGAALLAAAAFRVSHSSVFDVSRIEVSGLHHLTRSEVIVGSGVSTATNTLWLDGRSVALRLEDDPWIASATVTRSLPTTVRISIVERAPVARTITASGPTLVASDGTILGHADGSSRSLPRITVPAVSDGLRRTPLADPARVAAALEEAGVDVGAISVAEDGSITARLGEGTLVRFGRAEQAGPKARALAEILRWSRAGGRGLRTVDVSVPSAPAVTFAG